MHCTAPFNKGTLSSLTFFLVRINKREVPYFRGFPVEFILTALFISPVSPALRGGLYRAALKTLNSLGEVERWKL